MGRVAFVKANVTVTGFVNTRPSGSNLKMGLAAVIPAGGVASVVVTVIIVVDATAPAGMSRCALLSGSATVPPAAGVTDTVAVCAAVVFPLPEPHAASASAVPIATADPAKDEKDTRPRSASELSMAPTIGRRSAVLDELEARRSDGTRRSSASLARGAQRFVTRGSPLLLVEPRSFDAGAPPISRPRPFSSLRVPLARRGMRGRWRFEDNSRRSRGRRGRSTD
jgi:hypothetical protein